MSSTRPTPTGTEAPRISPVSETGHTRWTGWIMFGAVMMLLLGVFQAMAGLAAIVNDDFYRVGSDGLILEVDYTVWGWLHLILGVVIFLAGIGVLTGNTVARVVGVVLAMASALVNLTFLPAQPFWSLVFITVDVLVIYALIVHGREMKSFA
jgi:hypothetical protein